MIRDMDLADEQLEKLLNSNIIERNETLEVVIGLLNSCKRNTYFALDGKWGTGKTVFVRQLELLNRIDLSERIVSISEEDVKLFQENYVAYYYNAWQNDGHTDPIQSLLFNLVNDYEVKDDLKKRLTNITSETAKKSVVNGIKTLSKGFIDLESIDKASSLKDLIKDITTAAEREQAVSNIIKNLLPENKKFLFIIDELDRCSPSFAIKMLEAIKHYYKDDNVVFIVSTNNSQLAHTVKKHYGNDFDGAGYLNKFYDLVVSLPRIDIKKYITGYIGRKDDGNYYNIIPGHIAKLLDMTMRETSRYYASLGTIEKYLRSTHGFDRSLVSDMMQYLFVPLALGLKSTSPERYRLFISGQGRAEIDDICRFNDSVPRIARGYVKAESGNPDVYKEQLVTAILSAYDDLFDKSKHDDDFYLQEQYDEFHRTCSLISITSSID